MQRPSAAILKEALAASHGAPHPDTTRSHDAREPHEKRVSEQHRGHDEGHRLRANIGGEGGELLRGCFLREWVRGRRWSEYQKAWKRKSAKSRGRGVRRRRKDNTRCASTRQVLFNKIKSDSSSFGSSEAFALVYGYYLSLFINLQLLHIILTCNQKVRKGPRTYVRPQAATSMLNTRRCRQWLDGVIRTSY